MNFLRRLLKGTGAADSGHAEATTSAASAIEAFDFEVRMVYLQSGGAPKVWKTRSVNADEEFIYLTPPPEWGGDIPTDEPLSFYVMADARSTEFDAVVQPCKRGGEFLVKVPRPQQLAWKAKEGGSVHQKRKFVRVEVSLPSHISIIVPTLSGSTLKVDEPHDARMIDLSLEGCSMLTDFEPPVDRMVEVKVVGQMFPLSAQGKVVRVKLSLTQGFRYMVGIVFHNMTQVTRDMIAQYVTEHQKERA